jgi:hypothetical protein
MQRGIRANPDPSYLFSETSAAPYGGKPIGCQPRNQGFSFLFAGCGDGPYPWPEDTAIEASHER